jgi:ADP-ribose pyrophosphatase
MAQDFEHLRERGLTQERVFSGHILRIRVDTVALPNGEIANREIVEHPGAAAVVPLTDDGHVLLVRQYRYAINEVTLEIPAGKLEHANEDVTETARREFMEETGCHSGELIYLGRMHSSPAILGEVLHIFAARGFGQACAKTDPDEFLELVKVPVDEALAMIKRGAITDAKTIVGLLWVQQFGLSSEQKPPTTGTLEDPGAS